MKLEILQEYETRSGRHVQTLVQFNSDMGPRVAGVVTYPDGTQSVENWDLEGYFLLSKDESSLDIVKSLPS